MIINVVSDPTPPCPTCPAPSRSMGIESWTMYGPCKDGRYHHTTCTVAREEMATARWPCGCACCEAPENWRDLAARVAELEDHIRLGIAEDRISSSYGRDTEAVAVEAEIVARRGHDWGAVVAYPAPPLRPRTGEEPER